MLRIRLPAKAIILEERDRLKKIVIIVPAYNEEETIGRTLTDLLGHIQTMKQASIDVCVVNDGSTDRTRDIISLYKNVTVLDLPFNSGIGGAMQSGYQYAYQMNYDIAVQFDADGQHNPHDLWALISPLWEETCDMTIGSRFLQRTGYKGSFPRRIGIYYFSKLISFLTNETFTDPTSGFRAVNSKIITQFAKQYPKDYPEPEVLMQLHRKKFKIREISVTMKSRQGGTSSITSLKAIHYLVKVSAAIILQTISKV